LLGSGFQRRTFPFLWVPERSPTHLPGFHFLQLQLGWSVNQLTAAGFASTVIPGFNLLEIYAQNVYFLLDMYVKVSL
jgi:hypothetical protein